MEEKDIEPRVPPDGLEDKEFTGKNRKAFSKLRRELSDEDLSHPGAQKLLLDRLDDLEQNVSLLTEYQSRFYNSDKECAVLNEKIRASLSIEVSFAFLLTIGSLMIGVSPSFWDGSIKGPSLLILGGISMIGGILTRVIKR